MNIDIDIKEAMSFIKEYVFKIVSFPFNLFSRIPEWIKIIFIILLLIISIIIVIKLKKESDVLKRTRVW